MTQSDLAVIALQEEEYQVLESIYPECVSRTGSGDTLKLEVPIDLGGLRTVSVVSETEGDESDERPRRVDLTLSTLPPLLINISLPGSYPLVDPPQIVSIRPQNLWLRDVPSLQSLLMDMWQPGEGILYSWLEYLRSGDFLEAMELATADSSAPIRLSHAAPWLLAPLLVAHDASTQSSQFAQNSYPCSICLTSLKGTKCLQLSCKHIFCRPCLEEFWKLFVAEGDVGRVGCADPQCVKEKREADEEEVARVLTVEEVQRWRWLREKRAIEKDPTIVHCPMAFCQRPVAKPPSGDVESGWDRLRTCQACFFSFCSFCRRTWHGPITSCPIAHSEKLVLEYLATDEGSPERDALERRFGRANLTRLLATYEEERANAQWLKASTMACPGCEIHVEKSLGCNHMTCSKCGKHFCYRCGASLPGSDPYKHFSTKGIGCYYKLFDFQAVNEEWEGMEGGWEMEE